MVNGETWETVWEKPLSKEVHKKMLSFSRFVSDNYENLSNYNDKMSEFEDFISE